MTHRTVLGSDYTRARAQMLIDKAPAGYVAKHLGWSSFFTFSAVLALPGLVLILLLNRRLEAVPKKES